jgi:hypothetical protein
MAILVLAATMTDARSEDEQGCSCTRMNIPWEDIDEQRLLALSQSTTDELIVN